MKLLIASVAMAALALGACSDSNGKNAREQVEDAVGGAGAHAAAESMRVALEAHDLKAGQTLRDVDVLRENADDVPGDPKVSGITDSNRDGKDDDGKVELTVGDQSACLVVNDQNDVSVDDDTCASVS